MTIGSFPDRSGRRADSRWGAPDSRRGIAQLEIFNDHIPQSSMRTGVFARILSSATDAFYEGTKVAVTGRRPALYFTRVR